MGRFINADAFTATGQGLLGNNMFAYCNNNPVNHADFNGLSHGHINRGRAELLQAMVLESSVIVLANPKVLEPIAEEVSSWWKQAKREVYDYSRAVLDKFASLYDDHQPRVHHIVPWGTFSTRSTSGIVAEMQEILWEVGIDPRNDPLNLMIVSQGYHKHLHTDSYLRGLYNSLQTARGNREAVEWVLFSERIIIAFSDPYSNGY